MKRILPFFPYGAVAVTSIYTVVCLLVRFLVQPCRHIDSDKGINACGYEGMDNTAVAFSTDFFITIFVAGLSFHLYLQSNRKILTTLVFASSSLGYLCKGLAVRYFGNTGMDDGNGMKGFFFLTLFQYLCWTTSTVLIGFLVHYAWTLLEDGARFCGSVESKIGIALNSLSALVVMMGCFWNGMARWNLTDQVIDEIEQPLHVQRNLSLQFLIIGQLAWQGSYCLVLVAAAYVLGALAKQRPKKITGLPNYGAAAGIVVAQVVLAAFVIYYALPDESGTSKGWAASRGSSVSSAFINYFMLMSTYFLYNLFATLFLDQSRTINRTMVSKCLCNKAAKTDDTEEDTDEVDSSEEGSRGDIENIFFASQRQIDGGYSTTVESNCTGNRWVFLMFPMLRREPYAAMEDDSEVQETEGGIAGPGGAKIVICNEMPFYDAEKQESSNETNFLQFCPGKLQVAVVCSEEEDEEDLMDADHWNGAQKRVEIPFKDPESETSESRTTFVCEDFDVPLDGGENREIEEEDASEKVDNNSNRSSVRRIFAALGLSRLRSKQDLMEEEDQQSEPSHTSPKFSKEETLTRDNAEKKQELKNMQNALGGPPTLRNSNEGPAEDISIDVIKVQRRNEDQTECCQAEHQTTVLRIDQLEPELVQRREYKSPQLSANQRPPMLKYLLRRGKEKVFGSDLRFSKTGLHDNVIPNVSCIMGDGSIVGESDPIVEDPGSIVGFSAATSNSNQSHTATIDIELTAEKTQDEISGDRLAMQKSSSVQERICKLKSQKSGTRHKRLYSLSSRFSQRRELDSSIKLSVPQSQSEVTSKPAVQHCQSCRAPMVVQSEHQDYPDQQAKDPDAEDIDHDGISISTLSSFATEMDEDGSCSSESDASVFKHKESEEPETFRQSLLHVINPFKKEDEEVSSDDSSSDSEVSSIRIDSEFVASFDDSRYSDEADEHFNDIPVRDPFEVYKSFFGSREGSKDSIACQSFGKDFPQSSTALEPAFSLTERQQSSSICYNRSLADVSHCSSKETVNRSNLTTRVHQRE